MAQTSTASFRICADFEPRFDQASVLIIDKFTETRCIELKIQLLMGLTIQQLILPMLSLPIPSTAYVMSLLG